MDQNKKSIVIFIASSAGAFDWILPVCYYYKKNFPEIEVSLVVLRSKKEEIFTESEFYKQQIEHLIGGRCYDLRSFLPGYVRGFLKLTDVFSSQHGEFFKQFIYKLDSFCYRFFLPKRVHAWLDGLGAVTVLKDENPGRLIRFRIFYNIFKQRQIKVFYFIAGARLFLGEKDLWFEQSFNPLDLGNTDDCYLAQTQQEQVKYVQYYQHVPVVGVPKFEDEWTSYVRSTLDTHEFPNDKRKILLILKNGNSPIYKEISFADSLREMLNVMMRLNNVQVLIKPHPRQDHQELKGIVEEYQARLNVKISNEPIFSLATVADDVVCMPSGAVMDLVMVGKKPIEYFNYTALNHRLKELNQDIQKNFLGAFSSLDVNGKATSIFKKIGLVDLAENEEQLYALLLSNRHADAVSIKNEMQKKYCVQGAMSRIAHEIMKFGFEEGK